MLAYSIFRKTRLYWDCFLSRFFFPLSCLYQPKKNTKKVLIQNPLKRLHKFERKYGYFSPHPLVGKVSNPNKDTEIVCDHLHYIFDRIEEDALCELMSFEFISKVLAYRNLEIDSSLPIYTKAAKGKRHLVRYKVDLVFDLWREMKAFGLVDPQEKFPPLLLFRGTDFSLFSKGGRASIYSDMDPKGPGRTLFLHAKKILSQWIRLHSLKNEFRVLGYSLGGTLAAQTYVGNIAGLPKYPSFIFHPAGVPDAVKRSWDRLGKERQSGLKSYVADGDPVSKIGRLIGETRGLHTEDLLKPVTAHTSLYSFMPKMWTIPIDVELENDCHYRLHYTKWHRKMSLIFYHLGLKHLFPKP